MILRIAICGEEQLQKQIEIELMNILTKKNIPYEINFFSSLNNVFKSTVTYQLLYLNIDRVKPREIEIYHNQNVTCKWIALSHNKEFEFESIQTSPFRFISKNQITTLLRESIISFLIIWEKENQLIEFKLKNEILYLRLKDIMYIEIVDHVLKVVHHKGEFFCRGSLNQYEYLQNFGFIKTHNSFMVNREEIYLINGSEVELTNQVKIPLSRRKREVIAKCI
jgi:hypothetical protein